MSLPISVGLGLLALVGYGLQDYWGPLASKLVGAFESAMLIRVFALLFFLVALIFLPQQPFQLTFVNLAILLATGAFMLVGTVSYYKGAKTGNIAIIATISNSFAIITILLSWYFLHSSLKGLALAGVTAVILGTILTSFGFRDLRNLKSVQIIKGIEYGVLAMFGWGIAFFLLLLLVFQFGWFIAGLLLNAIMVLMYLGGFKAFKFKYVKPHSAMLMILLCAAISTVALFGYNNGVVLGNPLIVVPIAAASPLVTVLLAVTRQKERLEPNQIIGIAAIIIGLISLSL